VHLKLDYQLPLGHSTKTVLLLVISEMLVALYYVAALITLHYIKSEKMPKHLRDFTNTITIQKLWKRRQE